MRTEQAEKIPHKISTVTAIVMIILALLFDGLQFLLTLTVVFSLFSILITFIAEISFALWFFLLGVSYFGGKKSGMKMLSIFGSSIIELVPILDGLPGITAGVIGVIMSTRSEDKAAKPVVQKLAARPIPTSR